MAQHNCEDLKPTDNPSTVTTFTKADNDHGLNPACAHNPFASQVDQDMSFNALVPHVYTPGSTLLKEPTGDVKEKDYPVNCFKLIFSTSSI